MPVNFPTPYGISAGYTTTNSPPSGAILPPPYAGKQNLYYEPPESSSQPPKPSTNWTKKLARLIGKLGKWAKEFWPEATATFAALLGILSAGRILRRQKAS